jgi:segregation and condensation protein A
MSDTFEITTTKYQGPFELLLDAIKDSKIDIFDISLSEITAAYFEYLKGFSEINLNLASDFLIMAVYLLELKSRKLLPQPEEDDKKEEEEGIESELAAHLAEYNLYKQMAEHLKNKKDLFSRIYSRYHKEAPVSEQKDFYLTDVNLSDLVSAFERVYRSFLEEEEVGEIVDDGITLPKKIEEIMGILKGSAGTVEFERLFVRRTRMDVVMTFLAVLELCRRQWIKILQEGRFGGIQLRLSKA